MTNEDKQLLLKDLCARLPYSVKIKCDSEILTFNVNWLQMFQHHLNEIKPYLRPLSSMTEGERNEYFDFRNQELQRVAFAEVGRESAIAEISDWLNEHHFDYRELIPMGLALEAPEDMYKTE